MYLEPSNPLVAELRKSVRARSCSPSRVLVVSWDGVRFCAWCAVVPLVGSKLKKYCSDICRFSVMAWCYPQSEEGLAVLLSRQNYRCSICSYNWSVLADSLKGTRGIAKKLDYFSKFSIRLIKALKRYSPKGFKPEVDHILAIRHGGESIGLGNVRAICSLCHKVKSKVDNSGPRKK